MPSKAQQYQANKVTITKKIDHPITISLSAEKIYQAFAHQFKYIHSLINYCMTATEQYLYLLFDENPHLTFKLRCCLLLQIIYQKKADEKLTAEEQEHLQAFLNKHSEELKQISLHDRN